MSRSYRCWQHFVLEGCLGVKSKALSRPRTARSATSLTSLCLGDGGDLKPIHSKLGIITRLLRKARIDDEVNSINGQTRLGDVGGNDDLTSSRRGGFEDLGGRLCRKCAINWKNDQFGNLWP